MSIKKLITFACFIAFDFLKVFLRARNFLMKYWQSFKYRIRLSPKGRCWVMNTVPLFLPAVSFLFISLFLLLWLRIEALCGTGVKKADSVPHSQLWNKCFQFILRNAILAIGLSNAALLCSVTSGLVWISGIAISDGNSNIYKANTAAWQRSTKVEPHHSHHAAFVFDHILHAWGLLMFI